MEVKGTSEGRQGPLWLYEAPQTRLNSSTIPCRNSSWVLK